MKRLEESELSRPPSTVLEILCKLGKGSYGSVYKARRKLTGSIVAVKKVPVDSDLSEIVKEISIMQQCDSPYIVKCHGSLFDNQDLWICMEYCGAGSVADIMRLRNQTLHEDEIATILKYSLLGLNYLHQMCKIHRDIKAGNILLTNTGMAKLADFGVAGQLADTLAKRNTVIGTPYWMAPEVIQEVGYNCSADIWSLGITAIEMGDGKPPLGDEHPMRALFMIPSQPSPHLRNETDWSPAFVAFVNSCLARLPDARPSAADLLATDFVHNSKPCTILLPLIVESNSIREKRFADAKSSSSARSSAVLAGSGSGVGLDSSGRRPRRRVATSEVVDVIADANPNELPSQDNTGTMIQRSDSGSSNGSDHIDDTHIQGTLISLNSNGSNNDSRRLRGSRNGDLEDSLGDTMVINDSTDYEEEDDDDRGSVLVHETASLNSQPENNAVSGGGGDTLTRNFGQLAVKESTENRSDRGSLKFLDNADAAAAVAAAQRDCGVVGADDRPGSLSPLPANPVGAAQRPFAPFSRAFQEMGGGGDFPTPNALALANEPGGLSRLTYSELEQLLVNLGRDLETELRNLAVRYRHKRQPLLDAIAEKTAVTAGATSLP